jgi:hypothetical protein
MTERILYESRESLAKRLWDLQTLRDQGIPVSQDQFDKVFYEFKRTIEREDEVKLQTVRQELQEIGK